MKNILKLTLVLLLMISCKDTNNSKAMEGVLNEVTGKNEDINEKYDLLLKELGKKTQLSDAQLLEAFPKKLKNLALDDSEARVTSSNSVVGTFGNGMVRMEILDGAGQNAVAAVLPLKMMELNKVTSENNNTIRYSKKNRNELLTFVTDRDKDTQADYQSEIRFLYDDRFYVTLEAKGMTTDALWDIMDMDDLSRFKGFN